MPWPKIIGSDFIQSIANPSPFTLEANILRSLASHPWDFVCTCSAHLTGLLLGASLICGLFLQAGCSNTKVKPVEAPAPDVTIETPVKKPLTEFYEYIGRMEAPQYVEVRARVTGYLTKIHFSDGQEVAAGAPLFEIDNRPYLFSLNNAKARLKQAESQVNLANLTLARNKTLLATNAVSQQDYDEMAERQVNATAEVLAATAAVAQAELDFEFCSIQAPIAGRLSRANVTVGSLISSSQVGASPLTTIASVDPIHVNFDVDESAVLQFREMRRQKGDRVEFTHVRDLNQKVMVALSNESEFQHEGVLDFIDNQVRPETGTLLVRASLENSQRLFAPGFFVRVRVPIGDAKESLLVPERAILSDQSIKYVLVIDENNIVARRDITLGMLDGKMRLVRSGLNETDRVIVNGTQRARPGGKVNPVSSSAAGTTAPARGKE
ncbi:MAG: efflux RND transporter periplasmic adaptor subunit [Pirellulaceae bacterium]|nr:efflux RND transporter periplasmic adaptor subunit [Pirellulaceae bacterium]